MNVQWKSFGVGVATTLAIIAIILFPYRDEIIWAYKNRTKLGAVADAGSALKGLF